MRFEYKNPKYVTCHITITHFAVDVGVDFGVYYQLGGTVVDEDNASHP